MEVLELRDSQWTCQEAADGRLEVSTLREDYDTRRGLMVVLLMFVLPVSLVCSIYLLDKVVSAKVLVMVSLLGWCALLPWAAQKVKQGVHLLTGAGGLDVVGYLGGKVVRQDWLSPRRLEVRRKTIGVMNPDDEGWSTVDAWTLVAISRSGAVSELLWACERPRLEEVAERLKRAMELEDCLEPETSEKGHTNLETLLPVPADYHQAVILKPEQVAIISRKFHEPSRRKVSLGMAGMAALSLGPAL